MNPQTEELACLYVLDQLGAAERASVEARLPHDAELAAAVRTAESALASQIAGLPRHEPSATVAARIEKQIDGLGEVRVSIFSTIARWGIAAAVAASVGTLAYMNLRPSAASQPHMVLVGLGSTNSTLTDLPASPEPKDADASFIRLASLAEHYWKRPDELPVKPAPGGDDGSGYALFDEASNQGYIAIRRLPTPEEGKRYHLWLVDTASGQVREAGVLPAAESSRGLFFFTVAPDAAIRSDRLNFFVTAEDGTQPEGAQPKGKVVLGDRRI
jgi:anti-sigma-K factor RskA